MPSFFVLRSYMFCSWVPVDQDLVLNGSNPQRYRQLAREFDLKDLSRLQNVCSFFS